MKRILCIFHNGNMRVFKQMEMYIDNLLLSQNENIEVSLHICSLNTFSKKDIEYVQRRFASAYHSLNENMGFDILSVFTALNSCKSENQQFDYVVKIHTKSDDEVRDSLLTSILGSVDQIKIILDILAQESTGLIGSRENLHYNYDKKNYNHLKYLIDKFQIDISHEKSVPFVGGTMFWMKFDILKKLFWNHQFSDLTEELNDETSFDWNWYIFANEDYIDSKESMNKDKALRHYECYGKQCGLSPNLFQAVKHGNKTSIFRDGMIEHGYERLFSYATESFGYQQCFL